VRLVPEAARGEGGIVVLTYDQIRLRKTMITATDARVLAGLDPYGLTAHDIFLNKCTDEPSRFEVTEAMEIGNDVEPITLKHLARKRGITLVPCSTVVHPTVRHHGATPDALQPVVDGATPEYGAEVKAVGYRFSREWDPDNDEGFPDWVLPQVTWAMHCTGASRWYVGAIIGTMIGTWVVERVHVAEFEEALVELADKFWVDHVLTKKPPRIDASDGAYRMVKAIVGKGSNGTMLKASPEAEQAAQLYFEAQKELKAAEAKKQEAASNMIAVCGEFDGVRGDGWRLFHKPAAGYRVEAYDVEPRRKFDLRPVKGRP
jgi:predicted phage-related endonuclease